MSKMIVIMFCLSCLLLRGCGGPPEECRGFFDLPRQQRELEFKGYSLEKQIDLYLCGMRIEPPQQGFADDIADRGEPIRLSIRPRPVSARQGCRARLRGGTAACSVAHARAL